jgi:cell division septation protein DedD
LVPFGAVSGRVVLDANENGVVDPGERTIEGAVVVLDGGARSEQVRKGQFQFYAVRSGDHTIQLLPESLPEDMSPVDPAEMTVSLTRERQNAELVFLVSRHRRPELRRVFEAKARPADPAPVRRGTDTVRPSTRRPVPRPAAQATAIPTPVAAKPSGPELFAVQFIALNDPSRARDKVEALKASGFPAYLVEPPPSDPDAPYRVRIGRYATEQEARAVAVALQKYSRDKLWVVRER